MKERLKILLKNHLLDYNVLISIKSQFCTEIINGNKIFEYRKNDFKRKVSRVFIYETMPKGKIIGYFDKKEIIKGKPEEVWSLTKNNGGITKEVFFEYFSKSKIAYAYEIYNFTLLIPEINPFEIMGFKAPQSYLYI